MPFPAMVPRPIPTSSTSRRPIPHANAARPGSSVPRKSLVSLDKVDWRSELLNTEPQNYGRSLPSAHQVKMVRDESELRPETHAAGKANGVEVDLEGLIEEGKGKREKRVTTATSLGFDFIPNPTIQALPDTAVSRKGQISPALSNTPSTPALLATRARETSLDEDDDDWDRVSDFDHQDEVAKETTALVDADQDEDDIIVLGEMELEEKGDSAMPAKGMKDGKGLARRGFSYAAALGQAKA